MNKMSKQITMISHVVLKQNWLRHCFPMVLAANHIHSNIPPVNPKPSPFNKKENLTTINQNYAANLKTINSQNKDKAILRHMLFEEALKNKSQGIPKKTDEEYEAHFCHKHLNG